eukprot:3166019-Prymnesium_polylepis.1
MYLAASWPLSSSARPPEVWCTHGWPPQPSCGSSCETLGGPGGMGGSGGDGGGEGTRHHSSHPASVFASDLMSNRSFLLPAAPLVGRSSRRSAHYRWSGSRYMVHRSKIGSSV